MIRTNNNFVFTTPEKPTNAWTTKAPIRPIRPVRSVSFCLTPTTPNPFDDPMKSFPILGSPIVRKLSGDWIKNSNNVPDTISESPSSFPKLSFGIKTIPPPTYESLFPNGRYNIQKPNVPDDVEDDMEVDHNKDNEENEEENQIEEDSGEWITPRKRQH
jgi:hypothetical protein